MVVSLAAIALAASYLAASFATGGLETTFCALLVLGAVDRAAAGQPLASGALGIAATMAHPDHSIFYVALGLVLVWRRTPLRRLAWYVAPFVLLYVPYFVVRWRYYGQPLPNSYYVKSAGGSYFSQGAFYVMASMVAAGLVAVVPLAVYGVTRRARTLPAQFTMVAVPMYLVYVAKIGGDFMLGRLLVPVLGLVLVHAEVGVRTLVAEHRPRVAALALAAASLACVPTRVIEPGQFQWYLADERTFYPLETLEPLRLSGPIFHRVEMLGKYLGNEHPPPVYAAFAIGILGWVTDWRVVDIHGLIDPELAHLPLEARGRPGHERYASKDYIFSRGADLSAESIFDRRYDDVTKLVLGGETYSLTRYRADWLDPLRQDPTVSFVRFPEYIDTYIETIQTKSREDITRDVTFFDRYYFAANPDPARRKRLVAAAR